MTNTATATASSSTNKTLPFHGRTTGPARRSTKGQWTAQEDDNLCKAVHRFKAKNWKKIAECFKDRTDVQCLHRWQKVLNPQLVKGPWTKEEDEELLQLVQQHGPKKWSTIAQRLPGRIGKQCRERWHNHLNPAINKEAWTQEEELMLIQAHEVYGNKWAELTKFLPGRTDNAIKNHWNSSVKKKLGTYMASGLLSQFQGLPSESVPTSSRIQRQCGGDAEGTSEGSTFVRCSESTVVGDEEDEPPAEMSKAAPQNPNHGNLPTPPCDTSSNSFIEQNNEWVTLCSDKGQGQLSSNDLSLIDLSRESKFINCVEVDQNHEAVAHHPTLSSLNAVGFDTSEGDHPPAGVFNQQVNESHADAYINSQLYHYPEPASEFPFESEPNQEQEVFPVIFNNDSENLLDDLGGDPLISLEGQVNDFGTQIHPSVNETLQSQHQQQGEGKEEKGGALSYVPPRLDIPFLSCDLIQSCNDYSPLGIRQLMMNNCFTSPWDLSPSPNDYSPQAAFKTAAKTFTSTPSIFKKRHRDLLTPSASFDNPSEKKQQPLSSNLFQEKENLNPAADEIHQNNTVLKVQQPLVEQNIQEPFSSPDSVAMKSDTPHDGRISSEITSCENPCVTPYNNNAYISGKENTGGSHFATSSSSPPLEITVDTPALGMFGETPLKKSLESPSAWNSPWSTFLPGARLDTDITIEDIGYFTSPGESSYDALGLMKQLSEHTASAYANARAVLGDETPDSILKRRLSEKGREPNILCERRVLDFSDCGSPRKDITFSSPSSYLLKGFR